MPTALLTQALELPAPTRPAKGRYSLDWYQGQTLLANFVFVFLCTVTFTRACLLAGRIVIAGMCANTHAPACMHTCIYTCTCMHANTHMHVHAHICTYMYTIFVSHLLTPHPPTHLIPVLCAENSAFFAFFHS